MAGGWSRDGAVNEQIEASVAEELERLRSRPTPTGESLQDCADCGDPIAEARRKAVPGVKLCLECQNDRDARFRVRPGINRRGSKDSQLK